MNVLLTGAFGNVGTSTLCELARLGHHVRCFDLPTHANLASARRQAALLGDSASLQVVWGDLRRPNDIAAAVTGQDVVVHLAFIIPKLSSTGEESEARPDWSREINVGGTRNLIAAMKQLPAPPRLLFASSYHVFGRTQDQPPPRTVWDSVQPIEHYALHKVECERLVRTSGLEWSIFRLSAALPFAIRLDPGMFDVPLDNRMEFVHTRDVGLALANGIGCLDIWCKVLLIGGGRRCQYYYREIATRVLETAGVGMLPAEAFSTVPFATDWVDSTESQRLLCYQSRTLDDYIAEMKAVLGPRRWLIRAVRPLVRRYLLNLSPYYRQAHGHAPEAPIPASATAGLPSTPELNRSQTTSLGTVRLPLTPELKALLIETAHQLKGQAQRRFIARAVRVLDNPGVAERELGWSPRQITAGLRELERVK